MSRNPEALRKAWRAVGAALWTVDGQGRIRSWNPEAAALTGWDASEVLGRVYGDVFASPPPPSDEGPARFAPLPVKGGGHVFVLRRTRPLPADAEQERGFVEVAVPAEALDPRSQEGILLSGRDEGAAAVPGIVGDHPLMREVYHRVRLAADSNVSVIITGESGTGKELVASAIHRLSARAGRNFVKVNCSAIPETLLESELFGHVKGAFTGAQFDKVGRFQLADGGTLFLDEIGDISPLIQVKLLRVLQEKTFERVGESLPTQTDVRIVCATNRDLPSLVDRNQFREDLFYRINVFPIHVPSLAARASDIPLLIQHFVEKIRASTQKRIERMSRDAMTLLRSFPWPGNVRQLENAIEHAFVTARGDTISIFDLPPEIREGVLPSKAPEPSRIPDEKARERERILDALRQTAWNRTKASKLLGISRVTLWKRIKEFGLKEENRD